MDGVVNDIALAEAARLGGCPDDLGAAPHVSVAISAEGAELLASLVRAQIASHHLALTHGPAQVALWHIGL